jgi:methylmalonyl-CoA mutase N-terminal domain/subunit
MQQPPDDSREWVSASGIPLKDYYLPEDVPEGHRANLGAAPGEAPFHRGSYPTGYRTKPWRIFQLSGFGKPEDENERIQFLLEQGETGFIMEHDRNTADHLYNVDHPEVLARREDVGLTGAVMQSVRDIDICMKDLPIQASYGHAGGAVVQHAPFALAGYWTVAKRRGFDLATLPGTGQSDFFLTYLGCVTKQQIPTDAGLRFNADIMEFCDQHLPRWVPVSIAGYNGADSGLNAPQELGALFANAVEYLEEIKRRGTMDLERAARACGGVSFRMSMDIFEEASKLRAARLMWTQLLRERYDVHNPKVSNLRIHCVTAGSRMQYQQPINNIVRGTLMGLAAALGGVQSLGVSGYDEALSIPSEHAHQMSVRIQQILQEETNVTSVTDPLGGSYYIETLTAQLVERAWAFFDEIQARGWIPGCAGFGLAAPESCRKPASRVHGPGRRHAAHHRRHRTTPTTCPHLRLTALWVWTMPSTWRWRDSRRSSERATKRPRLPPCAISKPCCKSGDNIMPPMLAALDAEVTLGEIGDIYREAFGDWATPIQT